LTFTHRLAAQKIPHMDNENKAKMLSAFTQ
jgi:hypothetical protein